MWSGPTARLMSIPPRPPPPRPALESGVLRATGNSWPEKPSPRPSNVATGSIAARLPCVVCSMAAPAALISGVGGGGGIGGGPCAYTSTRSCRAAPLTCRRRCRRSHPQTFPRSFQRALPFGLALHCAMNDDQLIGDELLHRLQRRRHIEGDRGARERRPASGCSSGPSRHQRRNRGRSRAQGDHRQCEVFHHQSSRET